MPVWTPPFSGTAGFFVRADELVAASEIDRKGRDHALAMNSFDDLLAPVTTQHFRDAYQGRLPLHIPASGDEHRRALLDWASFNRLLGQSSIWTAQNLRLMVNGIAVPVADYCDLRPGGGGADFRPSPQKVDVFLTAGASLVANDLQTLHPPIAQAAAILSRAFAAQIGANVYCSSKDVQAFGTHYDNHDVFAVQTEGEKIWRIYENQIEMPVDLPPDTPEIRRWLEQARGPLMSEIRMRPGDVLYLPRGRFHDALAVDGASLHVTFSVTALYGRILFSLLDSAAMQFETFRAYFPPAAEDNGKALAAHLEQLGDLLSRLVSSQAFVDEVAMTQERLVPRPATFTLPERKSEALYRTTGQAFPRAGTAAELAYEWCEARHEFSLERMLAEFDFIEEAALRRAVDAAVASGALIRV